ncbi:hypothetical protein EL22_28950 [Halostagnicola sp. A56]|uniref:hypothetical protein n=1 Tax=Halostagnicola sp. A56 TaxID=1495067 RepID=UPI00065F6AEC|nr:hypothetical protein [Halostagnicola sp. A56]KMT45629.1 hypothetical protein EL22_28950 [Halostagnicola sp. A56]
MSVSHEDNIITAEVDEEDLQGDDFVTFQTVVETENSSETSGTYVQFSDDTDRMEDVYGFEVGETYDINADMIVQGEDGTERVTLSDGWELTQAYDANGDESNVVVTQEGMNTEFTGTGIEDRINAQQAIQGWLSSCLVSPDLC